MARIGITLNEVLRDFIGQLTYTYQKYIADTDIVEGDVTSLNLLEFYKFDDINALNNFLYKEAPLEIFGHADQVSDGLMNHLNNFIIDIEDEEEHEILIISREVDKSIPATNFFLSKTGCKATDIKYCKTYQDKWNNVDVLITANPQVLELKPSGKISIKIKAADYEIDSILDFINDEEFRNKILNTKTTIYEEI
jgi:hypothetical protein